MSNSQLNSNDFPSSGAPAPVKASATASPENKKDCNGHKPRTSATSSEIDSSAKSNTKSDTDSSIRFNTESSTESDAGSSTNPDTESNTDSTTELKNEHNTESSTKSKTEIKVEINTESNTDSTTELKSEPSTEPETKPNSKPKSKRKINNKRRQKLAAQKRLDLAHDYQAPSQLSPNSRMIMEVVLQETFPDYHPDGKMGSSAAVPKRSKPKSISKADIFMSGAVSAQDNMKPILAEDDNIDCISTKAQEQMPYKVIRRNELLKMDLALENQSALNLLPEDFVTTYLGMQIALKEWTESRFAFGGDEGFVGFDWDQQMVESLKFRGGYAPSRIQEVIYPEDIIPLELAEPEGAGWRSNGETRLHDEAYWLELKAQGDVWDTMPYIPVFPQSD